MIGPFNSGAAILLSTGAALAFQPSFLSKQKASNLVLRATVDPSVVTKKEYQDICGVDFDSDSLDKRLQRTSFLYPKHVEVIEDIAPIADEMTDNIVSASRALDSTFAFRSSESFRLLRVSCF
jgi:hypothetical protein